MDGTYALTSFTDYSPHSALVGQPTSGVFVFSHGTLQGAFMNPKGGVDRWSVAYSLAGTDITETAACGNVVDTTTGYTATATSITLIQSAPLIVSTFTRM